jgi:hypothetical protein
MNNKKKETTDCQHPKHNQYLEGFLKKESRNEANIDNDSDDNGVEQSSDRSIENVDDDSNARNSLMIF